MQNKFYKMKKIFYKIFNKVKKILEVWRAVCYNAGTENLFTKGGKEQA